MIDIYFANTGNSMRAVLALEECGLKYTAHKLDMSKGEHKTAEFFKINPMGQVPVIVDHDSYGGQKLTLNQSGAILYYAAQKSGKLIPKDPIKRTLVDQLVFAAITDINTLNRTIKYAEGLPQDVASKLTESFVNLQKQAFMVIQAQTKGNAYLAGDEFTLADAALYSISRLKVSMLESDPELKDLLAWYQKISERPAVKKVYQL